MWPRIYLVGSGFLQSWASTALIKVHVNFGHPWLTKAEDVREDRIRLLVMLEPCAALQKSLAGEVNSCQNWEPAPGACTAQNKKKFFLTSHFYDLLFVFQIFLTFNLPGSDSLLSKCSHVQDPLLILFHKILGFQMRLPCLVCKSFSTKDYGHV